MRHLVMGALAAAAALGLLTGCQGQGRHTAEGVSLARERMNGLKAGTEYDMARQQFLSGDLEKALRSVDRSIGLNGAVARSHTLRGRVLMEQGRLEESRESFRRAQANDPGFAEAWYYEGVLLERMSDYDLALASHERAAGLEPGNAQYAVAWAETLVDLGRVAEAREMLAGRASTFEHSAGIRQTLGHIALLEGDEARAAALFNEARLLAPDDPSIVRDLALAQLEAGQHAEAEAHLSALLSRGPEPAERRALERLRARSLAGMGRLPEAKALLVALTQDREGAKDASAWVELGRLSLQTGDRARLRTSAARAMALRPRSPEGFLLMAGWRRLEGDLPAALEEAERAVSLDQTNPSAWILRGVLLRELGRADEAAASLSTALRLDPGDAAARRLLSAVEAEE